MPEYKCYHQVPCTCKKEKTIDSLKKGDILYIYFAQDIKKAKVINNFPEDKKIFLKILFFPFGSHEQVFLYKDYNFKDFKYINK